jgi:hypothetical protein
VGVQRTRQVRHSPVGAVVGISLCILGLALIGFAWAGTTAAQLEVPVLFPVAGSLTGLGLVVVGAAIAVIDAIRRDIRVRGIEVGRLTATLAAINRELAGEHGSSEGGQDPSPPASPKRSAADVQQPAPQTGTPVRSDPGAADQTVELGSAPAPSTDQRTG